MDIPIASYTFAISTGFCIFQILVFISRTFIKNRNNANDIKNTRDRKDLNNIKDVKIIKDTGKLRISLKNIRSGKTRSIIFLLFLSNLIIFTLYNLLGLFVAYKKGYLIYRRSTNLTHFERILQIIEVTFDSIEKSTLFLSLLLFLPIFKIMRGILNQNTQTEFYFIVIFSIGRMLVYPSIYFFFYNYPMLALFIVEIMNISESLFLLSMFYVVCFNINTIIRLSNTFVQRRALVIDSMFLKFKFVAKVYFVQLVLEIVYKTCILGFTIMDAHNVNQIFLECAFLFRLVSFSLQSYGFVKLSDPTFYHESIFWNPICNEDYIFSNPFEQDFYKDKNGVILDEDEENCEANGNTTDRQDIR